MSESSASVVERRENVRVAHRSLVSVAVDGHPGSIRCMTVDVSVGGMRVESDAPLPLGRCAVVLDTVALVGEVIGQVIDVDSGLVSNRIAFSAVPPAASHRLAAITAPAAAGAGAAAVAVVPARRTSRRLVAAGVAVLVVTLAVAAAMVARGSSPTVPFEVATGRDPAVTTTTTAAPASPSGSAPTTVAAPPAVVPAPVPTTVAPPVAAVEPAAPAPSTETPAPAAPVAPRAEQADNGVTVHLAEDPAETVVASQVGPSAGVDQVRIQLDVIPEQQGTTLPIAVVIENRGDVPLEFRDGLTTTVAATRAGSTVTEVVLRDAAVTSLAPGARHELLGTIDLGSPGQYALTATTPVG
ncbi:MAG TPA: PilZ domain-containing protein [Acidimicrobiales bacterium]|nr:PilZ domain-containing protein [Acidimicrobiales bacterium]